MINKTKNTKTSYIFNFWYYLYLSDLINIFLISIFNFFMHLIIYCNIIYNNNNIFSTYVFTQELISV